MDSFSRVDPEKEDTYQEAFLVANWAHIYNQSLGAVVKLWTVVEVALQGEAYIKLPAICTERPACTVLLPSEPTLIKKLLKSYFNQ